MSLEQVMERFSYLKTERTSVSPVTESDAGELFKYFVRNQSHLAPWEPLRSEKDQTESGWIQNTQKLCAKTHSGSSYHYVVRCHGEEEIAAVCNFNNVVGGAFLACHLGFSVDHGLQGKGVMHEALEALIPFIFKSHGLHRIMANYMPRNKRSERLLNRLAFEKEGFARDYLKIAGKWEDHILMSRIASDVE